MKRLLVIPVLIFHTAAFGQQTIQYDQEVLQHYQQGVSYFEMENYKEANLSFRKALAANKVLPTNLSYYFAETLFHLGQFHNSKNFVEKYLDLSGYTGDFYAEAINLKDQLINEFAEIKNCDLCNDFGYRLEPCDRCGASGLEISECHQCNGSGNSLCPKCTGEGVVVTVDEFDQQHYKQCNRCKGAGHITCELCDGKKVITRTCLVCQGTKVRASSVICDHEDKQPELVEKN